MAEPRHRRLPRGLALVAGLLAVAIVGLGCDREHTGDVVNPPTAHEVTRPRLEPAGPESGLDFVHAHGGFGERFMMETMGSGVAVLDADGDGHMDLYFVQSGPVPWPGAVAEASDVEDRGGDALFLGRGDGTFARRDPTPGISLGYGMGVCAGDVDRDGNVDLFRTALAADALLLGEGDGTFRSAPGPWSDQEVWSAGCAFADFDRDGWLDLFVTRYVDARADNHRRCGTPSLSAYCHPDVYDGLPDALYRNLGDGTFEDVTRGAGVAIEDPEESKGLGVVWLDADDDGWPDIYVANDSTRNFLWRNRGDGTFEDVAIGAGTAYNAQGKTEAGMGVATGDIDGDGREEIFVTHLDYETNTLYWPAGGGLWEDRTDPLGLGGPGLLTVGFGTTFFDLELDGDLDLFVANGHIIDNVALTNAALSYPQRDLLFVHQDGRFVNVSAQAGPYFASLHVGRGVARGDLDGDGDEDLVISNSDSPAILLWNRAGDGGRSLRLRVLDRAAGPAVDAVGARVELIAGGRRQVRRVRAGGSYLSQHDPRILFGLGDATIDGLTVTWPDGRSREIDPSSLSIDRVHTIRPAADAPEP
ncbi:MAG: CRTAC1 family protein [Acidobacteriota bacterium]